MSDLMKMNGQALTYGNNFDLLGFSTTTNQLSFATYGMDVQVDRTLSVDGQLIYVPWALGGVSPNQGFMFNLGLDFRPN
jgi:hypothetical protein